MEFNLFALKKRLELAKGKEYSWAEMATGAGLHHNTLNRIGMNKTNRVDLATLAGLMTFFKKEGMPVRVEDLFIVVDEEGARNG